MTLRGAMNRRAALVAVVISVAVLVAAVAGWRLSRAGKQGTPVAAPGATDDLPGDQLSLFFPGTGRLLVKEAREITPVAGAQERARAVVEGLLAGPTRPDAFRPLPEGVTLASLHLGRGAVLYVDFLPGEEGVPVHGSAQELLSLYSVVNSLMVNVPEVRAVQLLWEGVQRPTFAGHLDVTHPLRANPDLIAKDDAEDENGA